MKERVLDPIRFTDQDHLLGLLAKEVIAPTEKLIKKRQERSRRQQPQADLRTVVQHVAEVCGHLRC